MNTLYLTLYCDLHTNIQLHASILFLLTYEYTSDFQKTFLDRCILHVIMN